MSAIITVKDTEDRDMSKSDFLDLVYVMQDTVDLVKRTYTTDDVMRILVGVAKAAAKIDKL